MRLQFLIFLVFTQCCVAMAQQTVSGRVLSAETNQPLGGATITVKATGNSAQTDATGIYKVEATAEDKLVITNVGYIAREVKFKEASVILLTVDSKSLHEVVVTALGIKREEKSLGFAAQTVKENAIKDAKTNNWVNSLTGKVAGLNIQGAGAGPMGSSRITLRGESSLNLDNNQALIVSFSTDLQSWHLLRERFLNTDRIKHCVQNHLFHQKLYKVLWA